MNLRLPYASRSLPFQPLACLVNLKQSNSRISLSAGSTSVPPAATDIPARDRIINFGKHKGKMLGSVPSRYLKWVSENVDSQWANLANQVLKDPIYQDRLEWEFFQNVISGEKMVADLDAGEEMLRFAERFGWDFHDKLGWRKVDIPLLGTSQGGRIPRISDRTSDSDIEKKKKVAAKDLVGGERRRDRIERQRTKRQTGKLQDKKLELGIEPTPTVGGRLADASSAVDRTAEGNRSSPFPGRQAFLKKLIDRQKPL